MKRLRPTEELAIQRRSGSFDRRTVGAVEEITVATGELGTASKFYEELKNLNLLLPGKTLYASAAALRSSIVMPNEIIYFKGRKIIKRLFLIQYNLK